MLPVSAPVSADTLMWDVWSNCDLVLSKAHQEEKGEDVHLENVDYECFNGRILTVLTEAEL